MTHPIDPVVQALLPERIAAARFAVEHMPVRAKLEQETLLALLEVLRIRWPTVHDAAMQTMIDTDGACSKCGAPTDTDYGHIGDCVVWAAPVNWQQMSRAIYENLCTADNQDVPLEEYPERIRAVIEDHGVWIYAPPPADLSGLRRMADEFAWLRKYVVCALFDPPVSEIERAIKIVDYLTAELDRIEGETK